MLLGCPYIFFMKATLDTPLDVTGIPQWFVERVVQVLSRRPREYICIGIDMHGSISEPEHNLGNHCCDYPCAKVNEVNEWVPTLRHRLEASSPMKRAPRCADVPVAGKRKPAVEQAPFAADDWSVFVRPGKRRGVRWDLAERQRHHAAKKWEEHREAEQKEAIRRQAAVVLQSAYRRRLAAAELARRREAAALAVPMEIAMTDIGGRPSKKKKKKHQQAEDNQMLDSAIQQAALERQQVGAAAQRLVAMQDKVRTAAGRRGPGPGSGPMFATYVCDQCCEKVVDQICYEVWAAGGYHQWCEDCVKVDIECHLRSAGNNLVLDGPEACDGDGDG